MTTDFFDRFVIEVQKTPQWDAMRNTMENSPWHREPTVAEHTLMTIAAYNELIAHERTERERTITRVALLFHDFGKPEAEETLEKKDEPGVFYRRYAGHEGISGNEFISFMCDHADLRNMFFEQGYGWEDVRKIKFMIEHHLPYSLKNSTKRANLRQAIGCTMGADDNCFWDMLRSDARGRISDDHQTKLENVEEWIHEFRPLPWAQPKPQQDEKQVYLLVGVTGAGKSTFLKNVSVALGHVIIFNEDSMRLEYAAHHIGEAFWAATGAERYERAWNFCHNHPDSDFDAFSKATFADFLKSGRNIVVDCMNQGRKDRRRFILPAKEKGYFIRTMEFFVSEKEAKERQLTRGDKSLSPDRVHQLFMQCEVPWLGSEVDAFEIVNET